MYKVKILMDFFFFVGIRCSGSLSVAAVNRGQQLIQIQADLTAASLKD